MSSASLPSDQFGQKGLYVHLYSRWSLIWVDAITHCKSNTSGTRQTKKKNLFPFTEMFWCDEHMYSRCKRVSKEYD